MRCRSLFDLAFMKLHRGHTPSVLIIHFGAQRLTQNTSPPNEQSGLYASNGEEELPGNDSVQTEGNYTRCLHGILMSQWCEQQSEIER